MKNTLKKCRAAVRAEWEAREAKKTIKFSIPSEGDGEEKECKDSVLGHCDKCGKPYHWNDWACDEETGDNLCAECLAKREEKTFLVDVHFDVAACIHVKAKSREEAEEEIRRRIAAGEITFTDERFENTDDTEVIANGEIDAEGNEMFY